MEKFSLEEPKLLPMNALYGRAVRHFLLPVPSSNDMYFTEDNTNQAVQFHYIKFSFLVLEDAFYLSSSTAFLESGYFIILLLMSISLPLLLVTIKAITKLCF